MREARRSDGGRRLVLLVLSACTLWLAMQNTLLVLAALWIDAATVRTLVAALLKAGACVVMGFWSSPAGLVLAISLAVAVTVLTTAAAARAEARHG